MASDEELYDDEEEELRNTSLYFVLFAAMLALVLILSKKLHESPNVNSFISEAALILTVGMVVGCLVWIFIPEFEPTVSEYRGEYDEYVLAHSLLSFSPNVFFMAMLPPIIFYGGYQLQRELFYRHITPIVTFACVGTTIAALCTGFTLYGIFQLGLMPGFDPTLLELLTFGALIAATDTVSVLSVFQAKRVDPHLFYLVFGESALNDAVALVLFKSFSNFLKTEFDDAGSVALKVAEFLLTLAGEAIGSPALGIIFGFAAALVFKHLDFREQPMLELPLYMLLMYVPFLLAECVHLSGVVAIFFSGISARRYISPNVSEETKANAEVIFKLASYVAETCIFLELGLSVFGLPGSFNWAFIAWAFLASLLGRAAGIYPLSFVFNFSLKEVTDEPIVTQDVLISNTSFSSHTSVASNSSTTSSKRRVTPPRRKDKHISLPMIHVLWFAGLRGAVAYACVRKFPNIFGHADEFTAATMVIVLISIIVMGGATESLLRALNIEMNVDEEEYMKDWRKKRGLKGCFHRFGALLVFMLKCSTSAPVLKLLLTIRALL